jgi:D-aminopeptidase
MWKHTFSREKVSKQAFFIIRKLKERTRIELQLSTSDVAGAANHLPLVNQSAQDVRFHLAEHIDVLKGLRLRGN